MWLDMDKLIEQLEIWTEHLLANLDSLGYEELLDHISQRQTIVDQLEAAAVPKHDLQRYHDRIGRLMEHDDTIIQYLQGLKKEASDGLLRLNTGRKQKSSYDTDFAVDGIFFDQRN